MIHMTHGQKRELIGFIRTVLGCGCPDEVLSDLKLSEPLDAFSGMPVDFLVNAGGRLLVALCICHRQTALEQQLSRCFETGRRMRDEEGFNRFRFVAAVNDPERSAPSLQDRFDSLQGSDDRLHLHIVDPSALPGFFAELQRSHLS